MPVAMRLRRWCCDFRKNKLFVVTHRILERSRFSARDGLALSHDEHSIRKATFKSSILVEYPGLQVNTGDVLKVVLPIQDLRSDGKSDTRT